MMLNLAPDVRHPNSIIGNNWLSIDSKKYCIQYVRRILSVSVGYNVQKFGRNLTNDADEIITFWPAEKNFIT